MVNQWYFSWGANKFGPFSVEEMKHMAAIGRLQPGDTVWKEGMEKGVIANRVKHLFAITPMVIISSLPEVVTPVILDVLPPALSPADPGTQPEIVALEITEPELPILLDAAASSSEVLDLPTPNEPLVPEESVPQEPLTEQNATAEAPANSAVAQAEATPAKPRNPPPKPRKATAIAVKGVIIVGQDGKNVQFRKKCTKCGYEDNTRQTVPIRNGMIRVPFYCPKCRKSEQVEIQGMVK
jgi:hypothetical protein